MALLSSSLFSQVFFQNFCSSFMHVWDTTLYLSTFPCCLPPSTRTHCIFVKPPVLLCNQMQGICLSAGCHANCLDMERREVCNRFLFTPRSRIHIHLILCLRGLVSDAFIVVSHVQAKANTLKQLLQCVCVFTLFYSFFRLLYGSKGSELELLTTSAQWQTDRELMISRFLFFFLGGELGSSSPLWCFPNDRLSFLACHTLHGFCSLQWINMSNLQKCDLLLTVHFPAVVWIYHKITRKPLLMSNTVYLMKCKYSIALCLDILVTSQWVLLSFTGPSLH